MNFKDYIEERAFFIIANFMVVALISIILYSSNMPACTVTVITVLYFISFISVYVHEYLKVKRYYENVMKTLDSLDEKYLLSEIISEPEEVEFKEFYEIIRQCNKAMIDEINSISNREKEFKEFIELWVHEVKTPISAAKLTMENNRNIITESIEEDMFKIEHYIEQALFYARSGCVSKDFIIKEIDLNRVMNESIKKYSKLLIRNKVKIIKDNLNILVYSDDKWLQFIIGQIISNSIKYFNKDGKILEFKAFQKSDSVTLIIKDNGIGIEDKYLDRIFDKGFTGDNGRSVKEATGLGLYLCRKLCSKLHIDIKADSEFGFSTTIFLTFPKSSQFFLK